MVFVLGTLKHKQQKSWKKTSLFFGVGIELFEQKNIYITFFFNMICNFSIFFSIDLEIRYFLSENKYCSYHSNTAHSFELSGIHTV